MSFYPNVLLSYRRCLYHGAHCYVHKAVHISESPIEGVSIFELNHHVRLPCTSQICERYLCKSQPTAACIYYLIITSELTFRVFLCRAASP